MHINIQQCTVSSRAYSGWHRISDAIFGGRQTKCIAQVHQEQHGEHLWSLISVPSPLRHQGPVNKQKTPSRSTKENTLAGVLSVSTFVSTDTHVSPCKNKRIKIKCTTANTGSTSVDAFTPTQTYNNNINILVLDEHTNLSGFYS